MRIGGEMELVAQSFGAVVAPNDWPRPLAEHVIWTDSGRSALFLAARDHVGRGGRARVHLPGFCCHSVMAPFRAAGFDISFYDITPDGAVCALPPLAEGDLVVVIHYFGIANVRRSEIALLAASRGARLIDDLVQASLNVTWDLAADYAVTSLRKFLNVPDGACLLSRAPVSADLAPSDEAFVSERLVAKLLRAHSDDADLYLGLTEQSEQRLLADLPRTPSAASALLIGNQPTAVIASRRRENWLALLEALMASGLSSVVVPVFRGLVEDEVPLGFPVILPDGRRDAVRSSLRNVGVYCPVHWDLPHVPVESAPAAKKLSGAIMTIPIDQRYSPVDMKTVVTHLMEILSEH